MVTIVSREQCGLTPANPARMTYDAFRPIFGVTVHCTVTPAADPVATWREIQREYQSGRNVNHAAYGDIPYHDGITQDGRILAGRDHRYVGAHALSTHNIANRGTIGVALIGTGDNISPAAQSALRAWVYLMTLELGRRPLLFDHLDWRALGGISTACPDPATVAFIAQLRAEARDGH